MKEQPSVSAAFIIPVLQYLQRMGFDTVKICRKAGLPEDLAEQPRYRVRCNELDTLVDVVLELTGYDDLGMRVAGNLHLGITGIVGYLLLNCRTIRDAINQYCIYRTIVGNIIDISTTEIDDDVHIRWHFDATRIRHPRIYLEIVSAATVIIAREISDTNISPSTVQFSFSRPSYANEYAAIYKAPILFDAPHTSVIYTRQAMEQKVRQPDPELFELLSRQAENELRRLKAPQSFAERVLTAMRQQQPPPAIGTIASTLNMNIRTLQIRLQEEGLSFRTLRDKYMLDLALSHLKNGKSIIEVSRLLGFSEPAAFHRSFRRWSGTTPVQALRDLKTP